MGVKSNKFLVVLSFLLGLLTYSAAAGAGSTDWNSILNSDTIFPNTVRPLGFKGEHFGVFGDLQKFLAAPTNLQMVYKNYVAQFDKAKMAPNDLSRVEIFKKNLLKIAQHNLEAREGKWSWEMGVNFFTDMTSTEIDSLYTGYKIELAASLQKSTLPLNPPRQKFKRDDTIHPSIDWNQLGYVSPVKNQGQCGSCVPFAATATLESSHALSHNRQILDLSEQEIVDCCRGNRGCRGGSFPPTFNYLKEHGLTTESQYKYEGADRSCRSGGKPHPARATGWWPVRPSRNEEQLKEAVSKYGPVAVAIHVNSAFQGYRSGVFDAACSGGRNHAVVVVGYGSEGGKDYWLIKNSWGSNWGERGFIRMRRNFGNLCDIAGDAVFINA